MVVKHLMGMFRDATAFKGDISKWDVSRGKRMHSMFHGAKAFKGVKRHRHDLMALS